MAISKALKNVILLGDSYTVCAEWFAGADIGAKINAAALSLGGGVLANARGRIKVAPGNYNFSTAINFTNTYGVTLFAAGSNADTAASTACTLQWTGGAGSGNMINLQGAVAFEMHGLTLTASVAAWDGYMVITSNGAQNVSSLHIHHCGFLGSVSMAAAIAFDTVISAVIEHCTFRYGAYHLKCIGTSNNATAIRNNYFDSTATVANIGFGSVAGWVIDNNIFESTLVPAVKNLAASAELTLSNNWLADTAGVAVNLFALQGFSLRNCNIFGNTMSVSAGGVCIYLDAVTMGTSSGISIFGNRMSGTGTAVYLGCAEGVNVFNNSINCTIALNAVATTTLGATKYRFENNVLNLQASYLVLGPLVANTSIIPITPAPIPAVAGGIVGGGLYMIHAVDITTGALRGFALVLLNHSAQTAELISPGAAYSVAKGTANRINIYYDAVGIASYKLENLCGTDVHVVVNSFAPY